MKKNLIILHTDQQRYDSLGCNGNPNARTQNIDALAEDGCRFTRHITSNPICMPSRASLMTGLHVEGHGVKSNGVPLWRRDRENIVEQDHISQKLSIHVYDKIPTLADILGENKYKTASFGKLHLEPHLADGSYIFHESDAAWKEADAALNTKPFYGFQEHTFVLGHGEKPCSYEGGHYGRWIQENHPEFNDFLDDSEQEKINPGGLNNIYWSKVPSELHHSTWIGDNVADYIETYSDEDPFFMFVGFPDPHTPFAPPRDIAEQFKDIPLPDFAKVEDIIGEKPATCQRAMSLRKVSKSDCALAYRNTMASVHLIDKAVGTIIDSLKEKGIYDDTIIIFTSDHGDYLGDLDMLRKSELPFKNLINVSFILKGTKEMTLPALVDRAMSNVDVVPTVLKMLDVETPEYIQGIDIFDDSIKENNPLVACYSVVGDERNLSILDDIYRYTYYLESGEEELYNHTEDPKELNNLVNDPSSEVTSLCAEFKFKLLDQQAKCQSNRFSRYGLW